MKGRSMIEAWAESSLSVMILVCLVGIIIGVAQFFFFDIHAGTNMGLKSYGFLTQKQRRKRGTSILERLESEYADMERSDGWDSASDALKLLVRQELDEARAALEGEEFAFLVTHLLRDFNRLKYRVYPPRTPEHLRHRGTLLRRGSGDRHGE